MLALTLLVTALAALLSRTTSPPTNSAAAFLPFTVAVLVSAYAASFWYPLLSSVLAALFFNYFLVSSSPHFSFSRRELLRAAVWLLFANCLALLLRRIRKSEERTLQAEEKETEVRAVLDRLMTAHRAAQIGTWDWDLRTNELTWSEEIYRMHGMLPGEFDGRMETWITLVHPDDLAGVMSTIRSAQETGAESRAEFRVIWPNGNIHWLCARGQAMVDEQGVPARMVGVGSDVTERRREDEALRWAEKLNVAGRLAAVLAHEINNPLQGLTNLVYLLRQEASVRPEVHVLLGMADELLLRMRRIAKQTLVLYRGSGTWEAVDVEQILEEMLSVFGQRIATKQLRIEKQYAPVRAVSGFRGELAQAFSHLLSNAIDASPHGATIVLRVKPGEPADAGQTREVRVEVEDFGPGIPPENQPLIFEPFFTTKADGSGLGLWASSQIVQKHGGTIEFRSGGADGKQGTCFSIALPMEGEVARAA